jgi:hypothetical protein
VTVPNSNTAFQSSDVNANRNIRNDCCGLSLNATNIVKFSDATNTARKDAHDDLLHEELNVRTTGNSNDIL